MAGIKDPKKEIDVAEVTSPTRSELLWCEELGFCSPAVPAR